MNAMIFDIQRASTVDGPGFRTTVFFKGCNLRCAWCHNPESQSFAPELLYYRDRCARCGRCARVCPHALSSCELCGACADNCPNDARSLCGREYTLDEVLRKIMVDRLFYETSAGGATFSGGECMLQLDFLTGILRACHENRIHTAVDTAGNVPFADFEQILPYTDMFLYDVKMMDSDRHRKYTGVGNELILSNLAKLLQMGKRVWVRVPIVPGVNDTTEEMSRIRAFLLENGDPEQVELLPYHSMGESKLAALGRPPHSYDVPDKAHMEALARAIAK